MGHPTTRVLAVLELLQSQGQVTGGELAARVGVDRRTLRRYIAMLEEMGIPITTEQGRYGGYRLVAGYKLPPMMFTDEEAQALSLGLIAARGLASRTPRPRSRACRRSSIGCCRAPPSGRSRRCAKAWRCRRATRA